MAGMITSNRITYVKTELFGRQLSDDETRNALELLNSMLEIEPKNAQTILGDLFALYAKPFVKITNQQNDCVIQNPGMNQWQKRKLSDLKFLLYNFLKSVFEEYRTSFCVIINESDDPTIKTIHENMIKKLGDFIKKINTNVFLSQIIGQARYNLYDQTARPRQRSCVYFVFQEHDSSVCKIGYTSNIRDRLPSLQTGNPNRLRAHRIIYLPEYDGPMVENFLHRRYANLRVMNEWYQLSTTDVDQIDSNEMSEYIAESIRKSQHVTTLYYRKT